MNNLLEQAVTCMRGLTGGHDLGTWEIWQIETQKPP